MKVAGCFLFMLWATMCAAQGTVAKIIAHVSNNDVAQARVLVDAHWDVDSVTHMAKFWYFSGYVYKRLYEEANSYDSFALALGDRCLEALNQASEAEDAEMYLDKIQRLSGGLLATYFDAAVVHVKNRHYELGEIYFAQYEHYAPLAGLSGDAKRAHIKFYKTLAKAYTQEIGEQSVGKEGADLALIEKAIHAYEEVLAMNETSYFALYNLGLLHLQMGQLLGDPNQEKAQKEVEKAEFCLKKAEGLEVDRAATKALLRLYEQTGNKEAAEVYREKLKKK